MMPAHIIDGKALAQVVRDQIAKDAAALLARTGIKPGLAAILVGDDPASHLYVKNKQKACEAVGIHVADHKLPASTSQDDLLALIDKVNRDPRIHGILVQLPLPKQIDSQVILNAVLPEKDADGFHPYNMGRLVEGTPIFEACTPRGVIKMIESTVVVDVGVNRTEDGKFVGDVDFETVSWKAGWISPVPGGVGPMTIAMLLQNTLESAQRFAAHLPPGKMGAH